MIEYKFNTGESNADLREKHNPEGSLLRKVQLRLLDMLIYVDKVCKEQDIEYILDGGNVLGAVRHGGFIPWDDDVDIILTKSNYDRLCKYLLENPHPKYVLQTPQTDPYFINHYNVIRDLNSEYIQNSRLHNLRKFRGLQIDLFPIETNVFPFFHKVIRFLHRQNELLLLEKCRPISRILFKINHKICIPLIRRLSRLFTRNDSYTYGYGLPWCKWVYPKDVLFPTRKIRFEGNYFNGPSKPKEFCKIHYGDYMNIPEECKRNHHNAKYRINE